MIQAADPGSVSTLYSLISSNAGGKVLFDETYKHWLSAQPREHIELKDIEDTLLSSAFQEKGTSNAALQSSRSVTP